MKLFTVIVLAACETAAPAPPAKPPAKPAATVAPRTLPNGRPACGNVMTKAPRPRDCEEKK